MYILKLGWVKILNFKFNKLNLQYDFGTMNSTLGSVVPLAMFSYSLLDRVPKLINTGRLSSLMSLSFSPYLSLCLSLSSPDESRRCPLSGAV